MNVRLTPRNAPNRIDLYGGVVSVHSNGGDLELRLSRCHIDTERVIVIPLRQVAEIALDDDPGGGF